MPEQTAPRPSQRPATARVGVVGGGQLARMMQVAAIELGVELHVLAGRADEPAVLAGSVCHLGAPDDPDALRRLAAAVDVVTLDHELVDDVTLERLAEDGVAVHPSAAALRFAKDKHHARSQLAARGFPVPAFRSVDSVGDVAGFADQHGWPVVCKATHGGYDGRGVVLVADREQARVVEDGRTWLVEEAVDLVAELAVLVARRPGGQQVVYPVVETIQEDGICVATLQPARVDPQIIDAAARLGAAIAEEIDATGIVAVELFLGRGGRLLVNELALRPHNSGHATIEACATSQFHNHLRAVLDWPLGAADLRAPAAIANLLGPPGEDRIAERLPDALDDPGAHVHLYGKASRPGRKLGHVTVLDADVEVAHDRAHRAVRRLRGEVT